MTGIGHKIIKLCLSFTYIHEKLCMYKSHVSLIFKLNFFVNCALYSQLLGRLRQDNSKFKAKVGNLEKVSRLPSPPVLPLSLLQPKADVLSSWSIPTSLVASHSSYFCLGNTSCLYIPIATVISCQL